MVPLSSVVKANWGVGPQALPRYNGYSAVEIVGNSASGYSTGQAMQTLQNIIDKSLPGRLCGPDLDGTVISGDPGGEFSLPADGAVHCRRVPLPGRPVRELVDSRGCAPGVVPLGVLLGMGMTLCKLRRRTQRHLFQDRTRHGDRPGGNECHPDRRICS